MMIGIGDPTFTVGAPDLISATGTAFFAATPPASGTTYSSTPGSTNTSGTVPPASTSTGDLISGIPNTYLYIGGAALLLLLVMKK